MNELEARYSEGVFAARNPEFYAQEQAEKQSMLDQAIAAAKGVGTIASGIAASAPAGVAGLAALPFKGMEGATQLIEDIQTALTYIPKDEAGQQMVQRIGGALEKLGEPAKWVGEKVLDATGSPAAATISETFFDPGNIAGAGAAAAIKPAAKAVGKVAKKAAENAAKAPSPPSGSLAAQRGAVGDLSQPFGEVFNGLKNKPEDAIQKLMKEKRGEVPDAFVHPQLGDIAFVYGDEKFGLKHIADKRGEEFLTKLPDILRSGVVVEDTGDLPRAMIVKQTDPAHVAVVRLEYDKKQKAWLITSYMDNDGKFAGGGKTANASPTDVLEAPASDGVVFSQRPGDSNIATAKAEGNTQKVGAGGTADDIAARLRKSGMKIDVSEGKDKITLSRIVVPEAGRNMGAGTKAMQELIDYADASGKRIVLTPSADFGGNKKRLMDFYGRFGFVENKGRARDLSVSETMIREPVQTAITPVDGKKKGSKNLARKADE